MKTEEGWLYAAGVLDRYSRSGLDMALKQRHNSQELVHTPTAASNTPATPTASASPPPGFAPE